MRRAACQPRRSPGHPAGDTAIMTGSPPAQALLLELRSYSVVVTEDWERLPASLQSELSSCGEDDLLARLIAHGLLTEYQAARISAGRPEELILGDYRILDRIGAGGMGVVFRAEHLDLRAPVAVKLLSIPDQDHRAQQRFLAEMRAVAKLQHPNIVAAMDAGKWFGPHSGSAPMRYFVMEFVAGQDLEESCWRRARFPNRKLATSCTRSPSPWPRRISTAWCIETSSRRTSANPRGPGQAPGFRPGATLHQPIDRAGGRRWTIDYMAPSRSATPAPWTFAPTCTAWAESLYRCLAGQIPFPAKENSPRR